MPSPDQPADEPIFPHLADAGARIIRGDPLNAGISLAAAVQALPSAEDIYGESTVLVLDGLPVGISESAVASLVGRYAAPIGIKIPDDANGPARAFIRFASFSDASKAAALNNAHPFDAKLVAFVVAQKIADREFPPELSRPVSNDPNSRAPEPEN